MVLSRSASRASRIGSFSIGSIVIATLFTAHAAQAQGRGVPTTPGSPLPCPVVPAALPPLPPAPPPAAAPPMVSQVQPTSATVPTAAPGEHPTAASPPLSMRGFEFNLRTGVAVPSANVTTGLPMSDLILAEVPLWIGMGGRVTDQWMIGGYFRYGKLFTNRCPASDNCGGEDLALGAEAHFHPVPLAHVDPWIGAGLGFEVVAVDLSKQKLAIYEGFEASAQVGVDFLIGRKWSMGPFAGVTVGQFDADVSSNGAGSFANKATHQWFTIGLNGVVH